MTDKIIGVGIVGYEVGRSWAAVAHVPALKALPEYDIVGVATTRAESAQAAADDLGLGHDRAFTSAAELAARPDVDVVAVTVKVPHHLELVRQIVAAGKHVYCEWPLGNGLAEAQEMAALVSAAGVKGVVGLQARAAPPVAYVREIVASGEIGEVLASNMYGTGGQWGAWTDKPNSYVVDNSNGASLLTIPFGHAVDAMCHCLGEFASLSATAAIRIPEVKLLGTDRMLPKTAFDQVAVTGTLESGAVAAVHYRGGTSRAANFAWEINGTKGDLRLVADGGHAQMMPLTLSAGFGDDRKATEVKVPESARWVPEGIGGLALNVAQVYRQLSNDLREGTATAASFDDAVVRHRMIAAIEEAAATGCKVTL